MSANNNITIDSISTTAAIVPGNIAIFSSGDADTGAGTVGNSVSGSVVGVVVSGKIVTTAAAVVPLTIQTSGLARVTVTYTGAATTPGARMILSATTANLATVAAAITATTSYIGLRGDYLGMVTKAATTTGTEATIDLRLN